MSANPVPVTVLCVIGSDDVDKIPQVIEQVQEQREVEASLVFIDLTRHGIAAVEGATVVRSHSWAEGAALKAAMEVVETEWVAWWDASCFAMPTRLARTFEQLLATPTADMALTAYFVSETGDRYLAQVDPAAMGSQLAPWWTSGVVVRTQCLAELDDSVGFPARLALFHNLYAEGRVVFVSTPLFHVPADAYIPAQRDAQRQVQFLERAMARIEDPAITVVVPMHNAEQPIEEVLTALSSQLLPENTVCTLVVDRTVDGAVSERFSEVSLRGPLDVIRCPSGGWATAMNEALRQVQTPLMMLIDADTTPNPDAVLHHLRAHQQLTGAPAVVLGSVQNATTSQALDRVVADLHARRNQELVPGQLHAGSALRLCNVSLPVDTVRDVGGFDERFAHAEGADQDLGIRLEAEGVRVYFQPEAVAVRVAPWTVSTLAQPELARAAAMVPLLDAHPDHLGSRIDVRLDRQTCETQLAAVQDDVERSMRAAEALASVDISALEAGFEGDQQLGVELMALLSGHVNGLIRAWSLAGAASGFRRQGIQSYNDLLARHPVRLDGARKRVLMCAPSPDAQASWKQALSMYLDRYQAEDDITLAMLAIDEHASTLMRALREESQRLRLHQRREPPSVLIVSCELPESQWLRVVSAADAWVPMHHAREATFAELAEVADLPVIPASTLFASREATNRAPVPYALAVQTPLTLLAWPDWSDVTELSKMWDMVRPMVGRRDVTLCLRLDPTVDGEPAQGLANLQQTFTDELGADSDVAVLIIDEPLDAERIEALSCTVDAAMLLPSSGNADREALFAGVGNTLSTPGAVSRWVARVEEADVPPTTPVLAHVG